MKKDLEYYMSLQYKMEIIPDKEEGGYTVCFPDLPGCITCIDNLEQLEKMAQDAKRVWVKSMLEDGKHIEEPTELRNYTGQLRLRMPTSLHRDLAIKARDEHISLNQYCIYLLSSSLTK